MWDLGSEAFPAGAPRARGSCPLPTGHVPRWLGTQCWPVTCALPAQRAAGLRLQALSLSWCVCWGGWQCMGVLSPQEPSVLLGGGHLPAYLGLVLSGPDVPRRGLDQLRDQRRVP